MRCQHRRGFTIKKRSRNSDLSSVYRVLAGNIQVLVDFLLTAENIWEQLNMYREQKD